MADLKNPLWMHLKAALFLCILLISFALILLESPHLRILALLCLLTWSSARLYYYCFYVIENYIDPQFRFSGLFSVLQYLLRRSPSHDPQRWPQNDSPKDTP